METREHSEWRPDHNFKAILRMASYIVTIRSSAKGCSGMARARGHGKRKLNSIYDDAGISSCWNTRRRIRRSQCRIRPSDHSRGKLKRPKSRAGNRATIWLPRHQESVPSAPQRLASREPDFKDLLSAYLDVPGPHGQSTRERELFGATNSCCAASHSRSGDSSDTRSPGSGLPAYHSTQCCKPVCRK